MIDLKKVLKNKGFFIAVAIYCILIIVMAYPLVTKITTEIPGEDDAYSVLARTNVLEKRIESKTGFEKFTYFANPDRYFSLTTYSYFIKALTGNVTLAFNVIWLISFPLAAIGAYLLFYYLSKKKLASFIAGLVYGFAPVHFAYAMGFGGATHIEFIPFYVLFLLLFLNSLKFKYALAILITFLFIVNSELHFAYWTIILTAVILIWKIITDKKILQNKKFWTYVIVVLLIGVSILVYKYKPYLKINYSDNNYLQPNLNEAIYYSADTLGVITPPSLNPFWGEYFDDNVRDKFTGGRGENTTYLGIIALIIAIFGISKKWHDKKMKLWFSIFSVFFILSLGPFLHFYGLVKPIIPMPYILLYEYLPFVDNIRSVARMFPFAMLAFSMLVGYGIISLKFKKESTKKIIFVAITGLLILDFWAVPRTSFTVPSPFYVKMQQDTEDYAIVHIPDSTSYVAATESKYFNSLHNKKVFGGMDFARQKPNSFLEEKSDPILNKLLYQLPQSQFSYLEHDYKNTAHHYFEKNNIKYIVIDRKAIERDKIKFSLYEFNRTIEFLRNEMELDEVYRDASVVAFSTEISKNIDQPNLLIYENGFIEKKKLRYDDLKQLVRVTKFVSSEENWIIENTKDDNINTQINMVFDSGENSENSLLRIIFDDEIIEEYTIFEGILGKSFLINNIEPGIHSLKIEITNSQGATMKNKDIEVIKMNYQEVDEVEIPKVYNNINSFANQNILQTPTENRELDANIIERDDIIIKNIESLNEIFLGRKYSTLSDFASFQPIIRSEINWNVAHEMYNIYDRAYYDDWAEESLAKFNIGYVVIDADNFMGVSDFHEYTSQRSFRADTIYNQDGYVAYRVGKDEPYNSAFPKLLMRSGFKDMYTDPITHETTRSIRKNAIISVYQDEVANNPINVYFDAKTSCSDDILLAGSVSRSEEEKNTLGEFSINKDWQPYYLQLPAPSEKLSHIEITWNSDEKNCEVLLDNIGANLE
ncbi:MAG: hypothetical protein ABIE68_02840 [bacterium]